MGEQADAAGSGSSHIGLGEKANVTEDERRAVELSSVDPDSGEHAEALAQLSDALWWDGRTEEARRLIENAVAAAHRSGSASAISWAHGMRAMQYLETDLERADLDCQVSWEYAMASGDPEVISSAYTDRFNLLWAQGDQRRMLEHARDNYTWSAGVGDTMFPAALLASVLLDVGDLCEAEGIVRVGLAAAAAPRTRRDPALRGRCSRRVGGRTRRRSVTWCAPTRSCPPWRSGHRPWRDRPLPRCCWPSTTQQGRSSSSSECCP